MTPGATDEELERLRDLDRRSPESQFRVLDRIRERAQTDDEFRRSLVETLRDASSDLKESIVRALRGLATPELCDLLGDLLPSAEENLRYHMVGACAGKEEPGCLDLLRKLARDESPHVASYAVRTLFNFNKREAKEDDIRNLILTLAREESRPLVWISFLRGMFLQPHGDYTSLVEDILQSASDRRVRYYAACALKVLCPSRLEERARTDEYLERIVEQVRVREG